MSETALPPPVVTWNEAHGVRTARWHSESGSPSPRRVVIVDDRIKADAAYRLACEGTSMLWRGDFQNARLLLQAMARRADGKPLRPAASITETFHLNRQAQGQRARALGMLLLPFDADYGIPLKRAPDVREACTEAWGPADTGRCVASLRELQGLIGAHEWRKKGIDVSAAGGRIHPHYGVFAPVRSEYVGLVAKALLSEPAPALAFDLGTGTGVLAAVLAKRGIVRVVATDNDPRSLACARENVERFGLAARVEVVDADLFPDGRAPLIVCNPPWIPAQPASRIERAVYDPGSRMLLGFLNGLAGHLEPGGEVWLVLSDISEHLGLRTRDELLAAIDKAGLKVVDRSEVRPDHPRTMDADDPLYAVRTKEMTSLWRLGVDDLRVRTTHAARFSG